MQSDAYWFRDVMKPAKIRICHICMLYLKSARSGFGFVTQLQLVQFSQVKKMQNSVSFKVKNVY